MSAIALRGVDIAYDADAVVRGVDLEIGEGELHVLLGESGSGKTTILRAIAGLERIAGGEIALFGSAVDGSGTWVPPEKRSVGVVFQGYALFPHLTVAGNIGFGMKERSAAAIEALLVDVGLAGYGTRPVSDLSGGEQQRVALARALAQRPRAMLLDEPFSNLNPALRQRLRSATLRVLRDAGVAAIFVTHDRNEAFAIADRLSAVHEGVLLQTGTPRDLYRAPVSVAVARSVGETIELPCTVSGDRAECALGTVEVRADRAEGEILVVRPEQLRIEAGGNAAVVVASRFFGATDELTLRVGDRDLVARAPHGAATAGDRVAVRVVGPCAVCRA